MLDVNLCEDDNWGSNDNATFCGNVAAWVAENTIPIPPAVWLFGSGLLGLVGIARRKKAA